MESAPASYLAEGEWPDGELEEDAPLAAHYAREISRRLHAAMEDLSAPEVSRRADLHHSTVYELLKGGSWPELISLVKLESALDVDLWPGPDMRK